MTFLKGKPRPPTSGRKPGSVNKRTLLVRDILEKNGVNLIEWIMREISEIRDPKDKAAALSVLLPYVHPKLTSLEISSKPEEERPMKEVEDSVIDAILLED